tara:strand:+ start:393 stop:542 length:150 start_codon:yes stop_codon:yes gene_type:complete
MKMKNNYICLISLLVPLAVLIVLNGCGKRGDPKSINNEKVYYPKKYPTH